MFLKVPPVAVVLNSRHLSAYSVFQFDCVQVRCIEKCGRFFPGSLRARACVQISKSLRNNKVINVIKDYGDCFRVNDFK
jgi:hypothetical protein